MYPSQPPAEEFNWTSSYVSFESLDGKVGGVHSVPFRCLPDLPRSDNSSPQNIIMVSLLGSGCVATKTPQESRDTPERRKD